MLFFPPNQYERVFPFGRASYFWTLTAHEWPRSSRIIPATQATSPSQIGWRLSAGFGACFRHLIIYSMYPLSHTDESLWAKPAVSSQKSGVHAFFFPRRGHAQCVTCSWLRVIALARDVPALSADLPARPQNSEAETSWLSSVAQIGNLPGPIFRSHLLGILTPASCCTGIPSRVSSP